MKKTFWQWPGQRRSVLIASYPQNVCRGFLKCLGFEQRRCRFFLRPFLCIFVTRRCRVHQLSKWQADARAPHDTCRLLQRPVAKHNIAVLSAADEFGGRLLDVGVVKEEHLEPRFSSKLRGVRACDAWRRGRARLTQADRSPTPSIALI